jgi:hypothetical protein
LTLFVNYFARPERTFVFNLTMARIIICIYGMWKIATYPFSGMVGYPEFMFMSDLRATNNYFFNLPESWLWIIPWEQTAIVFLLALVCIGWRIGITAFLAALLLSHLSGLNYLLISDKTYLPIIYFLILFGIYRHENDGESRSFKLSPLKWFLLLHSLLYFFTGVAKIKGGGLDMEWAYAENIRRILQLNALSHISEMPAVAAWVIPSDSICLLLGIGTLFLELGFFVAVLARLNITPFILGLAAMHIGILLTMQVNYFTDMGVLFLLMVPWDEVRERMRGMRTGRFTLPSSPAQNPPATTNCPMHDPRRSGPCRL